MPHVLNSVLCSLFPVPGLRSLALILTTLYTQSLLPIMPVRGCMRHFSALFSVFGLLALVALTACGGGNSTPIFGNPATITVSPASTSLTLGTVVNPNVIVTDSKGTTLFASGGAVSSNVDRKSVV